MELTSNGGIGARRTLALVCGVFLAVGVSLASIGPALPRLAANVGHNVAALGGLFTAVSAGVVLAQFAAGPASDRFGQRLVLAIGMVLMGCGVLGESLARSLGVLLGCGLLVGIGFGGVLAAGNVLIARLFPLRSAAALNGANVFFGVGSMLGPAVAGVASARLGLPQLALWLGAGLLMLLAPAVNAWAIAASPARSRPNHAEQNTSGPASVWLLALLLLFYTGTEVGFGGWVTLYLMKGARLEPATAALAASGFWLALTLGRALGAVLGLRLAPPTLLMGSLLGMTAGAGLLVAGAGTIGGAVAGVLLFGLACGPVFPTVLSLVTTATSGSSVITSRVLALGNGGGLIIPALLGVLLSWYGPPALAVALLTTALVMLVLCVAARVGSPVLRAQGEPGSLS
jgi:MFS transporter, FHS family, L-fucose permease